MIRRYFYLYRGSLPRVFEQLYWPLVNILVWGFLTIYLQQFDGGKHVEGAMHFEGTLPNFVAMFLGGLILWDILFRCQTGVTMAYMEEVWSRNLLNLFVTPIRPLEFIVAFMCVSILKVALTTVISLLMAYLFFGFDAFVMGAWLAVFMASLLLFGVSTGVMILTLILRYGQGVEALAWGLLFVIQPVSAVFYPVSVLPEFLQPIAYSLPTAHIFEGMRQVLDGGGAPIEHLLAATGLNAVFLMAALLFFYRGLSEAKREGRLLRVGE
jgi:ABC-2 type transport system permease protein